MFTETNFDNLLESFEEYTQIRFPIYIPSKRRPGRVLVARQFDADAIPYRIVVEPQDYDLYLEQYPAEKLLALDLNDGGIAYVRNFIKDHALASGYEYHWQFDDNVRSFAIRRNGKAKIARPVNALSFIESVVTSFTRIGGANFSNGAFAFSYDNKSVFALNNQVYCAMLLRTDTKARFRKGIHEDTDYSLQILSEGWSTIVCKRVVMTKTNTMTMSGGNTDSEYAGNGRRIRFERLVAEWPEAKFRLKERNGVWTVTPSRIWGKFPQRPQVAAGV